MVKFTALTNLLTLKSSVYGITDTPAMKKLVEYAVKDTHELAFKVLEAEAEKLARMVKEEIMAQPPSWPPLNSEYRDWKVRVGLNDKMLMATEAYWNAIAVQEVRNEIGQFTAMSKVKDSTHFSIRVGLPFKRHPGLGEDQGDDDKNLRYDELAAILEYGTDKIPARPHWAPSYRRWKSQHGRSVKARITSLAIRKFMKDFKRISVPAKSAKEVK